MTNFMQMMQKAQVVKQKMQEMQTRVQAMSIAGVAGAGLVTCQINGRFEVLSLKIDPSVVNPNDKQVMEDLIVAALNDARNKAEKVMTGETEKVMLDAGLPPGLGLPF